MKIAVILTLSLKTLSISGMSMRDASYFLSHVSSYKHSTATLLQQAMQLAEANVPELVRIMRQNGSKVNKYAMTKYLQGSSSPLAPRIDELNNNLALMINNNHSFNDNEKTTHLATLKTIFTEVSVTARVENFVNANKTKRKKKWLSEELQRGIAQVNDIRSHDVRNNRATLAEPPAKEIPASQSTYTPLDYTASPHKPQDLLLLLDNYHQSSIALLHKATEIAGVTFHKLLNKMRKDNEPIGKHSIHRILKGERIAADARYLQLQQGLEKTITTTLDEQEAQIVIDMLGKVFNEILTVTLPLERFARDHHHKDLDETLQPIFAKTTTLRTQAIADYPHYLAKTRQAAKSLAPSTAKAIAAARLAKDKQRLARYEHSSHYYLRQALALANVQTLSQLRGQDLEVEIFTGNVQVFKRDFDTAPLQNFLQDTGTISSHYVRELKQRLHQQLSPASLTPEEEVIRRSQLDTVIAAALEALQVENIVAHSDATILNLVAEFAHVEQIKKRDLITDN